jgi:hypothetical protein
MLNDKVKKTKINFKKGFTQKKKQTIKRIKIKSDIKI